MPCTQSVTMVDSWPPMVTRMTAMVRKKAISSPKTDQSAPRMETVSGSRRKYWMQRALTAGKIA